MTKEELEIKKLELEIELMKLQIQREQLKRKIYASTNKINGEKK